VSIRHGVVAAVAVAFATSGALSGCSEADSEPPDSGLPAESELTDSPASPSPTEPSSTGSTPSRPREPRLPAAAKAPGKAGAKAFVAYYIRLLNYASWTGDTDAVRSYGKGCRGCGADAGFFEGIYDHGGRIIGGRWSPVPGSWVVLHRHPGYFLGVNIDSAKGTQIRRKSAETKRVLAERLHRDFHLVRDGEHWNVTYMEAEL
jgi:Family of unknown function (DUF6318)